MTKHIEKEKAIKLRKAGHSYNYIVDKVMVSKSTLHYWLADISYVPNKETVARIGKARAKSGEVKSKMKRESIRKAQLEAQKDIGVLSERDLFMLGIGLYIGEGGKTHNIVRIINANPEVMQLAVRWFEVSCGLTKKNFSIALHLYPDNNLNEAVAHWERVTGIPRSQFSKTQIDRRKNKKAHKKDKLPHGTAHLTIKSCGNKKFGVFLSRKICAWMDEVYRNSKQLRA